MLHVQLRQHARRRGEDEREADPSARLGRSPLTSAEPTAPTAGQATRSSPAAIASAAHSGISACFTFGCNSTQEAAAKISTKPMMSAVVNRSPR